MALLGVNTRKNATLILSIDLYCRLKCIFDVLKVAGCGLAMNVETAYEYPCSVILDKFL